jgi:hypothetical protein
MRIESGRVKANKKDIEDIKTFLLHAKENMWWGYEGTYGGHDEESDAEDKRFQKELEAGFRGLENIEMLLEGLCDKWNQYGH